MSNLREAAQQALEALKTYVSTYNDYWERGMEILQPMGKDAISKLEGALAQPKTGATCDHDKAQPVATDRDLHSHMMIIAMRAWESRDIGSIKAGIRAIVKAIAADQNLREKLAAPQPPVGQVCKCSLRTRQVGDGCVVCNPELAKELAEQGAELSDAAARAGGDYWQDTPSNIRNEIIAAVIAVDRAARGGDK